MPIMNAQVIQMQEARSQVPAPAPAPAAVVALEEQVHRAIETAMSDIMVPTVHKAVQESFATLARPLKNSMDSLSKKGVSVDASDLKTALDVETPLRAAFADTMRNVVVPAL